jgi:anti-sigma factor RsiW
MSTGTCQQIEDRLVDYADGELPADQAREVSDHLAQCPHCRQVVQGLQNSLRVAQGIWSEAFKQAAGIKPDLAPRSRTRWLHVAAIAATIAVVAGGIFLAVHRPSQGMSLQTVAQIEQGAERAATAARLVAATEILAQCQDTQALVQAQYRHILADYPETPAAADLRKRGL